LSLDRVTGKNPAIADDVLEIVLRFPVFTGIDGGITDGFVVYMKRMGVNRNIR
jgi:hypothetical protein